MKKIIKKTKIKNYRVDIEKEIITANFGENMEIAITPEFFRFRNYEITDGMNKVLYSLPYVASDIEDIVRFFFQRKKFYFPIFFKSGGEYSILPTKRCVFSEDNAINFCSSRYGSNQKIKVSDSDTFGYMMRKLKNIKGDNWRDLYVDYLKFLIENTENVFITWWAYPPCENEDDGCRCFDNRQPQHTNNCYFSKRKEKCIRQDISEEMLNENILCGNPWNLHHTTLEKIDSSEFVRRNCLEFVLNKISKDIFLNKDSFYEKIKKIKREKKREKIKKIKNLEKDQW